MNNSNNGRLRYKVRIKILKNMEYLWLFLFIFMNIPYLLELSPQPSKIFSLNLK